MKGVNNTIAHRVSSTLLLSIFALLINYLISFLLTPYITENIGTEAFGFVTLAKTISNYGIIITGCLNAFSARYITIAFHKNEIANANRYFSSVFIANVLLLILVSILNVFFIWKLQLFIKIPSELLIEVKILFALDIINYMALTVANTFTVAAYITNKLDRLEIIKIVSYLTEVVILVLLFSFGTPHIFYVGLGLIISTIVLWICNYCFCKKNTPLLKVEISKFSWAAVKDLVVSGIWNSINSIGNLLNSGLDLWVTNLMLSAKQMGELSIVKTVSTIVASLQSLIGKPFQPYLLKYYSGKDIKKVVSLLNIEIKLAGYISNMICVGLLCFGRSYFKLWTPNQNTDLLYYVMAVTVIGFWFEGVIQPLFYTYTLTLKNKIPCYLTIFSGLLNVLGMYLLLKYTSLNLYAVVGTTTVLGFFTFLIFTPIYTAYCLKEKWNIFYLSILRVMISAIIIYIVVKLVFSQYNPNSWLSLIFTAFLCCLIAFPIHILCVCSKADYLYAYKMLKSE